MYVYVLTTDTIWRGSIDKDGKLRNFLISRDVVSTYQPEGVLPCTTSKRAYKELVNKRPFHLPNRLRIPSKEIFDKHIGYYGHGYDPSHLSSYF